MNSRLFYTLSPISINLGAILYFWKVQPLLLVRLAQIPEQPDLRLGIGLLSIQLLEIAGLWLKYPLVRQRIAAMPSRSALGAFVTAVSVMGHMGLITAQMSFTVIKAFGVELRGQPPLLPSLLAVLFFIGMLTKEGILLVLTRDLDKAEANHPIFRLLRRHPRAGEWAADAILALFSVVAYTVTWEQVISGAPFSADTLWGSAVEYFGAVLFFCMVFPATQPLSVAETWLTQRTRSARFFSLILFLIMMITAIATIPRAS